MTQKEKLLTYLCRRLAGEAMFPKRNMEMYEQMKEELIEVGDLVMCSSSGVHDWSIGTLVEKGAGFDIPWVIKEIGGERLCNITNDSFYKIPKDWIPDKYLITDEEFKVYEKCIKALRKCEYGTLYHSISFDGKECTLNIRKKWSRSIFKTVKFTYNSKTTIKSIVELVEKAEENEVKLFWDKD